MPAKKPENHLVTAERLLIESRAHWVAGNSSAAWRALRESKWHLEQTDRPVYSLPATKG